MGISIIENGKKIYYNNEEYPIGSCLTEFINTDFSKFEAFINSNIENEITFKDFFDKFLSFDYKSLYFKIIKNSIINFYENFDDTTDYTIPFPYRKIENIQDFKNELFAFVMPLFSYQKRMKSILEITDTNNKDFANQSLYERLFNMYGSTKNILNVNYCQPLTIYEYVDKKPHTTIKFDKEKNLIFELHFSNIKDFLIYEFKLILNYNINIAQCPACDKFFPISHGNNIYCSKKCKTKFEASEEHNLFQATYRKIYGKFKARVNNNPEKYFFPKEELETIKAKYKSKFKGTQEELDKFVKELNSINSLLKQ